MTWKNGGRVSYAVVNGETGTTAVEPPVVFRKFLLGTALAALPIFLLLELFLTLRPMTAACVGAVLALIMLCFYADFLHDEINYQRHASDTGRRANPLPGQQEEVYSPFKNHMGKLTAGFIVLFLVSALAACVWGVFYERLYEDEIMYAALGLPLMLVLLLTMLCLLVPAWAAETWGERLRILLEMSLPVSAALLIGCFCLFPPVEDFWYYGVTVLCLSGVLVAGCGLVRRYNHRVTHPEPHFFTEREARS